MKGRNDRMMHAFEDDHRETWPSGPPTLPTGCHDPASGSHRVARRSGIDLLAWIHGLRSDETTRPVSLDDVLERALAEAAMDDAHVVRQITCSAVLDGSPDPLVRFFAGIAMDVLAGTATTGPSARTILLRVDVEGPHRVAIEIADLRRVVGSVRDDVRDDEAIEVVRASDAMLGVTVSMERDPVLGTVVRIELPARPRQ